MKLACCCVALLAWCAVAQPDEVPVVETPLAPLQQNLRNALFAWGETEQKPLLTLREISIASATVSTDLQQSLDPHVCAIVTINPESRVKVAPGPKAIDFVPGYYSPQLIKIINEGGITARLQVTALGDAETSARLYEDIGIPLQRSAHNSKLIGQPVEYQVMLLRSMASTRREITLSFQAGADTQDLGFRAELPCLVSPTREQRMPDFVVDKSKFNAGNDRQWRAQVFQIRERVQLVTGPIQYQVDKPFELKTEPDEIVGGIILRKISLDQGRNHAWLLMPQKRTGKLPTILCLHQTTKMGKAEPAGLGGLPNLHYALELAQRGFITVAPDYPGYGDAVPAQAYKLGFHSTTAQGIANHKRLIDWLCTQPDVDPDRLGCIGHSLGGHNTLFLGLFDERIKVLATSCGFCSFPKYYNGNLKGWSHAGYMPRIASIYQSDPKQMPFDFTEILAALAPRPVFINAPLKDENFAVDGVRDCVKAATPIYLLFNKIDNLVVEYPDAGHDFPREVRERCYAFFAKHLK